MLLKEIKPEKGLVYCYITFDSPYGHKIWRGMNIPSLIVILFFVKMFNFIVIKSIWKA